MQDTVLIALIAFISSAFTIIFTMILKLCYASKCVSTSFCCGCLEIKRDTIHEQNMNELGINNIKIPNPVNNNVDL